MIDYVKSTLKEAQDDMDGEAMTPAANHLFTINTDTPIKLDKEKADLFHHFVAKLFFLCKRARPDIQTAIAFLCTRVRRPDTDDYKKLARVIKYLRATMDLPLTLEADNLSVPKRWVDASFAVHDDMKSHTGGALSLGNCIVYETSTRQKINTKSSTESEFWQGFKSDESIVYQDNQSSILLENYGKASSSKRTRHINIRYFFITDRVKSKEVKIATGEMVAEHFTKPLQGALFVKFRDIILGYKHVDSIIPTIPASNEERVGSCRSEYRDNWEEEKEDKENNETKSSTSVSEANESEDSKESKSVTWTTVARKRCFKKKTFN